MQIRPGPLVYALDIMARLPPGRAIMSRYAGSHGGKEMIVPYHNYDLNYHLPKEQTIGQKFINPDHMRWEKCRVWVVEATLKAGRDSLRAPGGGVPHRLTTPPGQRSCTQRVLNRRGPYHQRINRTEEN
jgi:hypothetical protein